MGRHGHAPARHLLPRGSREGAVPLRRGEAALSEATGVADLDQELGDATVPVARPQS